MFGRSRSGSFQLYGKRRSRWRPPGWLVLLLFGIGLGAAGVVVVQERYLPPRLSASESTALQQAYAKADAERVQLRAAQDDRERLAQVLSASRATEATLREDLALAVESLPPDPRGGAVQVRAWRFEVAKGQLDYQIVLTRDAASGPPQHGVMQLTVEGESDRGSNANATLKPVALSIGRHAVARGSLPLPDGLRPRQATVQVLDRAGGKALGMRVFFVK